MAHEPIFTNGVYSPPEQRNVIQVIPVNVGKYCLIYEWCGLHRNYLGKIEGKPTEENICKFLKEGGKWFYIDEIFIDTKGEIIYPNAKPPLADL